MRSVHAFRDGALGREIARAIRREARADRHYRFMEFCGGHTHALCRHGLLDVLPANVEMIHGPGCPVCVLPIGRLDQAIALARTEDVVLCTFGDMMRVPASARASLMKARAEGADVRIVLGPSDALAIARAEPSREVVFFAVGFETTTPPTALALLTAEREELARFSVLSNHVLTPPAVSAILAGDVRVDGLVGPGHVSAVIGTAPYEPFAREHEKPIVVAGFEPIDLLQSILMLLRQVNEGRAEVENQYTRAVTRDGNPRARAVIDEALELRPSFEWRGLGTIPSSARAIRERFARFDAERRFGVPYRAVDDHPACACPDILRGRKKPTDCKIFGTACTPESPIGSCMVSPEGACAAYYTHRGVRLRRSREARV